MERNSKYNLIIGNYVPSKLFNMISNCSDDRDNTDAIERQQKKIEELKAELSKYKKAYNILNCYYDSISDEEQPKVAKKLEKLGL